MSEEKWTSKMKDEWVLFEKDKERKIATITLNRPETLNAMTLAMYDKLNQIVADLDTDEDVKVIVFNGTGEAFCSGFDVEELGFIHGQETPKHGERIRRPSQRERLAMDRNHFWGRRGPYATVLHCLKATIASVHKYCYGAGLEFALACDITIAAEGTLFTHPGWQYIGPTCDLGLLIQTIGVKKTKEMTLTGIPIDAQEALRVGLVNKVVPIDKLEEETMKMAEVITHRPFDGIVMGKAHFEAALEHLSTSASDYIAHAMQTNLRYEPGEYNLFKERRDTGRTQAIRGRMKRFSEKERLSV